MKTWSLRYVLTMISDSQLARAAQELNVPYLASGGFADGRGLAAALALGADVGDFLQFKLHCDPLHCSHFVQGINMGSFGVFCLVAEGIDFCLGTRFMCTIEAPIHHTVKEKIVASTEKDTTHIFRTLHNTARVFKNKVAEEVVRLERRPGGAKFEDVRGLVAGTRGRRVYETGDIDAGIWSAGVAIGLIKDIPTCENLLNRIQHEAEEIIDQMSKLKARL